MRILFTNNTLDKPAGTELSLRDAAVRLKERGHEVVCFSRQHGEIASLLKEAGIKTVTQFAEISDSWVPDVIHGHHEWETSLAAMRYPTIPVISFCRGVKAWQEAPCIAPNVVKYAVVDVGCRDRLVNEHHIPESKIEMILNGIDLERFQERTSYNPTVSSVLVFSNYATEENYLKTIRAACEAEGVACEAIGNGVGRSVSHPAKYLERADLVFAKGKAVLEACSTGALTVVCDEPGLAPDFVTSENFPAMRRLSFGYPLMTEPHRVEMIQNFIQSYDPQVAADACHLARNSDSIETTVDNLQNLYEEAINTPLSTSLEAVTQWASSFFEEKTVSYKLGRESQAIWRNIKNDPDPHRHAIPDSPSREVIESHRVLDSVRKYYDLKAALKEARSRLKLLENRSRRQRSLKRWFRK